MARSRSRGSRSVTSRSPMVIVPPENTLLTPSKTILLTVRQDNASMTTITAVEALDIRFPTSRSLDGSDAMNPDPDYSAAYVIVRTDDEVATGHGFTFTIGRGNEICVAAIEALRPLVVGRSLEDVFADMGAFWRSLVGDSQLRWIGPEKGAIHLATAAVVNAVWDLYAK